MIYPSILKLILLLKLFVILRYNVVQGLTHDLLDTTKSTNARLIARNHLFVGDYLQVFLLHLRISEESSLTNPPLIIISVMMDNSLGYDVNPFFPFFTDKVPVLNLNAANDQDFIKTPSTVAFQVDFISETFNDISSSPMVDLNPIMICIEENYTKIIRHTKQSIEMIMLSSKADGHMLYYMAFVVFIDSAESEGLYKFYFHSYENVDMVTKVLITNESNEYVSSSSVLCFVWLFIFSMTVVYSFGLRKYHWCLYPFLKVLYFIHLFGPRYEDMGYTTYLRTFFLIILFLCVLCMILMCHHEWMIISNSTVFCKIFHIFVGLMMIHGILRINCNNSYSEYVNMVLHFSILLLSTVVILQGSRTDLTAVELKNIEQYFQLQEECTRFRRYLYPLSQSCLHIIYVMMVCFDLVLALMISLGISFSLHWLQIAIEETLCILLWLLIVRPLLATTLFDQIDAWIDVKENNVTETEIIIRNLLNRAYEDFIDAFGDERRLYSKKLVSILQ